MHKPVSKPLSKWVYRIGWISFFADLSSEMLYPIVPVFLTTILTGSAASLGWIEGCAEFVSAYLKVKIGKVSDRSLERKRFIAIGYFISTLGRGLTGFASGPLGVGVSRSIDRVGKGIRTGPRDALLHDCVPKDQLGEAFGLHRAMDTFGAVLGPLIPLFVLSLVPDFNLRLFFMLSVIPGLVSVALTFRLPNAADLLEGRPEPDLLEERVAAGASPPRVFYKFLLVWCAFCLFNSSDVFLLLKLKESGYSISQSILFYLGFNLIYAGLSSPLGKLSDRFPKQKLLGASILVFSLAYFLIGVKSEFLLGFAVYGVFMAMSEGVSKAFVAELIEHANATKAKAQTQGVFAMATGGAIMLACIITGSVWDSFGSQMAFQISSLGALCVSLLLWFFKF